MSSKYVRINMSGDWDAFYVDGKLDRAGDAYLTDERISQLLGVQQRESAVMGRIIQRDDVPKDLAELDLMEADYDSREAFARVCEEQAQALAARAAELRAGL